MHRILPIAAVAALLAAPSFAADIVNVRTWKVDEALRNGWSAENLIDTEVRGPNGEAIGEVENLIVGPDGKIRKLVVETGGIWDIGDKHLAVDWKDVKVGPGVEYVTVPITEATANNYGLFDDLPERVAKKPREWRATELLDDYVLLKGGMRYGYVDDLIFAKEGDLKAVIVSPDLAFGPYPGLYAYPYYGYPYGWEPGLAYYELPYAREDIATLTPIDYDALAIVRIRDVRGTMDVAKGAENKPAADKQVALRETTGTAAALDWERGAPIDANRFRASELLGRDVINLRGKEVGDVEDIVIGKQDKALYAVVSVGGFLGMGDKDVAIPFDQLRMGANNVILMSQQTEEQLETMPSYDDGMYTRYER
jgi:sporulation protein YlmC with PRC-barrel domain